MELARSRALKPGEATTDGASDCAWDWKADSAANDGANDGANDVANDGANDGGDVGGPRRNAGARAKRARRCCWRRARRTWKAIVSGLCCSGAGPPWLALPS